MFSLSFSKKSGLLYIRRDKAQLYIIGSSSSIEVAFDKAVFENLEIKDKDAFESSIKEIIQKINQKGISVLIVLSNDVVFRKDLTKVSEGQLDQEINKFIDAIPMDNDRLEYRIMPVEEGVAVIATNSLIYNIARDACESSGWEVEAIVPSAFFGVTSSDMTLNVFAQISKAKVSFGETDFMRKGPHGKIVTNPVTNMNKSKPVTSIAPASTSLAPDLTVTTSSVSKKTILMIALIVVLFSVAGFLIKKYYFTEKAVFEVPSVVEIPEKTQEPVVTETVVETPVETPSEAFVIDKSELRFNILNSTKVSGLASKAKDAITAIGYSNIKVGNSTEILSNTQIFLYKGISEEYQTEISDTLKKTFNIETIDVKEDLKEVYDFDVQITIAGVQ